jgi:hypothetical protein
VLAGLLFLQAVLGDQSLTAKITQAKKTSDEDLDVHIEDFLRLAVTFYELRPQKLGAADVAHIIEHVSQVIEGAARLLKTAQLSSIVALEVRAESKAVRSDSPPDYRLLYTHCARDLQVSRLAMDLLLTRLENVKAAKRQDLKPALSGAYERILADLAATASKAEKLVAYKYLESLTRHASSDDLSSVTSAFKQVLSLAGSESSTSVFSQQVHFLHIAL